MLHHNMIMTRGNYGSSPARTEELACGRGQSLERPFLADQLEEWAHFGAGVTSGECPAQGMEQGAALAAGRRLELIGEQMPGVIRPIDALGHPRRLLD